MPIIENFKLPESPATLAKVQDIDSPLFLAFIASKDPLTKQPWCPDVRASLPTIRAAFASDEAPTMAFVEVGQRAEYKAATSLFRTTWNVPFIPTLIRYERVGGELIEIGRLVEGEILDKKRLQSLVNTSTLA